LYWHQSQVVRQTIKRKFRRELLLFELSMNVNPKLNSILCRMYLEVIFFFRMIKKKEWKSFKFVVFFSFIFIILNDNYRVILIFKTKRNWFSNIF
jgi:hypothetical protein